MGPISEQSDEVQLPDATRKPVDDRAFDKDHSEPCPSSEDEHRSGRPDVDHMPTPIFKSPENERLSFPPITEDLSPQRQIRIVSFGHNFLTGKVTMVQRGLAVTHNL